MKSLKTQSFNKAFEALPKEIQEVATAQFQKWKADPKSIMLKPLDVLGGEVVSCPVNYRYRGLAFKARESYVWSWIGSHEDYNKLVTKKSTLVQSVQNIRQKYDNPLPTLRSKQ